MPAFYESGFQVEKPAWHGLGRTIPADQARQMSIGDFIQAAELNWSVVKVPLMVPDAESVPNDDGTALAIPGGARGKRVASHFGVYRDSDWQQLGVVGRQYVPLQNEQAFHWFQPWLDAGQATMETAGSLYGGSVVWCMAKLSQDDDEIVPGDTLRRYILLSTSHDGSQATYAGFTDIRTVCANTLAMAQKSEASKILRTKHTKSQLASLELIRKTMDLANQEFVATADQFRKMARCAICRDDLVKYVKVVLEVDEGTPESPKELSTRRANIIDAIVSRHDTGYGSDIARNTVWGAYNSVAEWLSYERGRAGETRLKSLWFGDGAKINKRAVDLAIQLTA